MSANVQVNLLPDDVRRKGAANRRNLAIGAGFLVLIAAVGGATWVQMQRVDEAQEVVDAEQATLNALQAEQAELAEFARLRDLRKDADAVLLAAMGREASVAGILQDIATVMPPDSQLDSFTMTLTEHTPAELGDNRDKWGSITVTGQTRLGHAPGLERFLLEFDKIAAFSDLFFSNSTVNEIGVSTFNAEADLGPEILTGRYLTGLPEALR